MHDSVEVVSKDYERLRSWYLARLRRAQLGELDSARLNPSMLMAADNKRLQERSVLYEPTSKSEVWLRIFAESRKAIEVMCAVSSLVCALWLGAMWSGAEGPVRLVAGLAALAVAVSALAFLARAIRTLSQVGKKPSIG